MTVEGGCTMWLCVLVFAVLIGSAIGAIILRAACWLFNKFAGDPPAPGGVPEPDFGQAFKMAFVTMLVQFGVSCVVGLMGAGGAAAGGSPQTVQLVSSLISLPISFLVLSAIVAGMLPTSFAKGMGVAALYWVIFWVIGLVLVVVFMILAGVLMGAG